MQPAKTFVTPRSSPLGTFRAEECLRLSGRNSILMMQLNVYIINPVVMGFQMKIYSILGFSQSILVKCCVHLRTSSSKLKCLFQRRLYSTNIDRLVRDSSRLHLTFVAFCLLSVTHKQQLKQCNYSVDIFYVISMEFLSLSRRRFWARNVPSGKEH